MNTHAKFYRRFLVMLSILLATLWLPQATFAQDANTPADHCDLGEVSVGFGEIDPADKSPQEATTFASGPNYHSTLDYAGFAETDPTAKLLRDTIELLYTSTLKVPNGFVGFSETDPSAIAPASNEVIYHQIVSCLGGNIREAAPGHTDLSSLTEIHGRKAADFMNQVVQRNQS